jgi:hypothetical protein
MDQKIGNTLDTEVVAVAFVDDVVAFVDSAHAADVADVADVAAGQMTVFGTLRMEQIAPVVLVAVELVEGVGTLLELAPDQLYNSPVSVVVLALIQ